MSDILQVHNITAGYGDKRILNNISLRVKKGSFLGIAGPNGAGKTTLLKAISGVLKPSSGSILFDERDLYTMSPAMRARHSAFVPQDTTAAFSFTVGEIVKMGRYPHGGRTFFQEKKDADIVRKWLEFTDTDSLEMRDINELSAGERQRAVIARALVQEPELLMLDEPTAHLDIGHQARIFDLLRGLNRKSGLTVITVLHDLNLAGEYCERIILLEEGRITADGHPEEVIREDIIERMYRLRALVRKNPVTGKPFLIPLTGSGRTDKTIK